MGVRAGNDAPGGGSGLRAGKHGPSYTDVVREQYVTSRRMSHGTRAVVGDRRERSGTASPGLVGYVLMNCDVMKHGAQGPVLIKLVMVG